MGGECISECLSMQMAPMHDANACNPLYHRKPSKPALRDMRDHIQAIKASGP